jgi:carboxypeptidase Q
MGSEEMRAILTEWNKPLHNLGMAHLFTSGAYHEAYAEVGLPGFYFKHDRSEMDDWNAHTSMDVYERLFADGMQQTAIVVATYAYHAAMRDEKLPRVSPRPW